ncbi:MAG: hypothetical protein M3P85_09745, partial [Actinomycetota bacterium]|nr:hypothetical protein [Actinomycetota bacterium]
MLSACGGGAPASGNADDGRWRRQREPDDDPPEPGPLLAVSTLLEPGRRELDREPVRMGLAAVGRLPVRADVDVDLRAVVDGFRGWRVPWSAWGGWAALAGASWSRRRLSVVVPSGGAVVGVPADDEPRR